MPISNAAPAVRPTLALERPHDPSAFTQGLLLDGETLYESTGLYGESSLRRVDLDSGAVLDSVRLGEAYFGEGLAALGGRLYQLTWLEERVFVYDPETLAPLDTLVVPGEAWGLATDGDRLVLSDGSDRLRWVDPATFATVREVRVRDGGRPVPQLNELEVIDGFVYANVWQSGSIAVIDPADGIVIQWLDLTELTRYHQSLGRDVLNGIAYDAASGHLLVTGKLWPTLYAFDLPVR
ncbi:MAG: glutaminyl-peptide cyclotransferase [Bacteroidota bacterium]